MLVPGWPLSANRIATMNSGTPKPEVPTTEPK